jgi:hypothetical protein
MVEAQPRNGIVAGIDVVGSLELAIVEVHRVKERPESVRRHDVGATLLRQKPCTPEVIWVRVCDHDRMDAAKRDAGIIHAPEQGVPRRFTGESGVHESESTDIFDRIRIDVSKPGEVDWKLQSEDARCHFCDLGRGVLLLLFLDPRS